MVPFAEHTACTIEMANLQKRVDIAVIDEIQVCSVVGLCGCDCPSSVHPLLLCILMLVSTLRKPRGPVQASHQSLAMDAFACPVVR